MSVEFICDVCGEVIPFSDIHEGLATRRLITPDSAFTQEEWETLCKEHKDADGGRGVSETR